MLQERGGGEERIEERKDTLIFIEFKCLMLLFATWNNLLPFVNLLLLFLSLQVLIKVSRTDLFKNRFLKFALEMSCCESDLRKFAR